MHSVSICRHGIETPIGQDLAIDIYRPFTRHRISKITENARKSVSIAFVRDQQVNIMREPLAIVWMSE